MSNVQNPLETAYCLEGWKWIKPSIQTNLSDLGLATLSEESVWLSFNKIAFPPEYVSEIEFAAGLSIRPSTNDRDLLELLSGLEQMGFSKRNYDCALEIRVTESHRIVQCSIDYSFQHHTELQSNYKVAIDIREMTFPPSPFEQFPSTIRQYYTHPARFRRMEDILSKSQLSEFDKPQFGHEERELQIKIHLEEHTRKVMNEIGRWVSEIIRKAY
jgi:hypothetical protein